MDTMMSNYDAIIEGVNILPETSEKQQNTYVKNNNATSSIAGMLKPPELTAEQLSYREEKFKDFDFNERYVRALGMPPGSKRAEVLNQLSTDFIDVVQLYGKLLISEMYLRESDRVSRIKNMGGIAGGDKYVLRGIYYKVCKDRLLDENFYMYGGEIGANHGLAAKASALELKASIHLARYSQSHGIHIPMQAVLDYKGFRLTAMPLVPIHDESLIYGSNDGGNSIKTNDPYFNRFMEILAEDFHLSSHIVKNKIIHAAGDVEGHIGDDGRYYLIDLARAFPPESPNITSLPKHSRSIFYRLFRAEFLHIFKKEYPNIRLSPDSWSVWGKINADKHNKNAQIATNYLLDKIIPNLANKLCRMKMNEIESDTFLLSHLLHSTGVNMRHLGLLRYHIGRRNMILMKRILDEMVGRSLKSMLRDLLRSKHVSQGAFQSEFESRKAILNFLNCITRTKNNTESQQQLNNTSTTTNNNSNNTSSNDLPINTSSYHGNYSMYNIDNKELEIQQQQEENHNMQHKITIDSFMNSDAVDNDWSGFFKWEDVAVKVAEKYGHLALSMDEKEHLFENVTDKRRVLQYVLDSNGIITSPQAAFHHSKSITGLQFTAVDLLDIEVRVDHISEVDFQKATYLFHQVTDNQAERSTLHILDLSRHHYQLARQSNSYYSAAIIGEAMVSILSLEILHCYEQSDLLFMKQIDRFFPSWYSRSYISLGSNIDETVTSEFITLIDFHLKLWMKRCNIGWLVRNGGAFSIFLFERMLQFLSRLEVCLKTNNSNTNSSNNGNSNFSNLIEYTKIKTILHSHELSRVEDKRSYICDGIHCNKEYNNNVISVGYKCDKCDYDLCEKCVILYIDNLTSQILDTNQSRELKDGSILFNKLSSIRNNAFYRTLSHLKVKENEVPKIIALFSRTSKMNVLNEDEMISRRLDQSNMIAIAKEINSNYAISRTVMEDLLFYATEKEDVGMISVLLGFGINVDVCKRNDKKIGRFDERYKNIHNIINRKLKSLYNYTDNDNEENNDNDIDIKKSSLSSLTSKVIPGSTVFTQEMPSSSLKVLSCSSMNFDKKIIEHPIINGISHLSSSTTTKTTSNVVGGKQRRSFVKSKNSVEYFRVWNPSLITNSKNNNNNNNKHAIDNIGIGRNKIYYFEIHISGPALIPPNTLLIGWASGRMVNSISASSQPVSSMSLEAKERISDVLKSKLSENIFRRADSVLERPPSNMGINDDDTIPHQLSPRMLKRDRTISIGLARKQSISTGTIQTQQEQVKSSSSLSSQQDQSKQRNKVRPMESKRTVLRRTASKHYTNETNNNNNNNTDNNDSKNSSSESGESFVIRHRYLTDGFETTYMKSKYGIPWKGNDAIGCMLDYEKGEIRYYLNGVDLGTAFHNVKHDYNDEPFMPFICNLGMHFNKISIVFEKRLFRAINTSIARINTIDNNSSVKWLSPLLVAMTEIKYNSICCLLESNADPEQIHKDLAGSTPLLLACQHAGKSTSVSSKRKLLNNTKEKQQQIIDMDIDEKIVQILLNKGADVTATTYFDDTCLHLAIAARHIPIMRQLLPIQTLNIHARDRRNFTPLMLACQFDDDQAVDIVRLLIQSKSDLSMTCPPKNMTPLHLACVSGSVDVVRVLLQEKADLGAQTNILSENSLHLACIRGNTNIVKVLLDSGINRNQRTSYGDTPLHLAASNNNIQVVEQLLVDYKFRDSTNKKGWTSIHHAACEGHVEVIKLILKHLVCDWTRMKDYRGRSPIELAKVRGRQNVIDYLYSLNSQTEEERICWKEEFSKTVNKLNISSSSEDMDDRKQKKITKSVE